MNGYEDNHCDGSDHDDDEPPPLCASSPGSMSHSPRASERSSSPDDMPEFPRVPASWQSAALRGRFQVPADYNEHIYGLSPHHMGSLWNDPERVPREVTDFDVKFNRGLALHGIPEGEPEEEDCMCCGLSFPVGTHDGEVCTSQQMQESEEACLWARFWM